MHVTFLVITVLAALANGYAACLNFVGAESVKVVADRVQVSRGWMVPLGTLLASGAIGLVAGFAVPALGMAAAIGLVLYFVCAVTAHLQSATARSAELCSSCSWRRRPSPPTSPTATIGEELIAGVWSWRWTSVSG
jgi:DoxX-like family